MELLKCDIKYTTTKDRVVFPQKTLKETFKPLISLLIIVRQLARWQHRNQRKGERWKLLKDSVTQPCSVQSSEALTLSLSLLSDCPWFFTRLKPNSHLSQIKPVPAPGGSTDGPEKSSRRSPGVKKPLTDVLQSPYTHNAWQP